MLLSYIIFILTINRIFSCRVRPRV